MADGLEIVTDLPKFNAMMTELAGPTAESILPIIPFFRHDGAIVKIAVGDRVRVGDNLPGTLSGKGDMW
jgi:hypothetical protein